MILIAKLISSISSHVFSLIQVVSWWWTRIMPDHSPAHSVTMTLIVGARGDLLLNWTGWIEVKLRPSVQFCISALQFFKWPGCWSPLLAKIPILFTCRRWPSSAAAASVASFNNAITAQKIHTREKLCARPQLLVFYCHWLDQMRISLTLFALPRYQERHNLSCLMDSH